MTTTNDKMYTALNLLYGTTTLGDGLYAHRQAVGQEHFGGELWDYLTNEGSVGTTVGDMANDFWGRVAVSVNLLFEDGSRKLWENGDFAIAG